MNAMIDDTWMDTVSQRLVELYSEAFGGKESGRYRIPTKLVREMAGRRRLYEDDVRKLSRVVLEKGFLLIDMETFFVVMSANSFTNYRRASGDSIEK